MIDHILTIVSVIDMILLYLTFVRSVFIKFKITSRVVLSVLCLIVLMSIATITLSSYAYIKIPLNFILLVLYCMIVIRLSFRRSLVISALFLGILTSLEMLAIVFLQHFTKLTEFSEMANSNGGFLAELICQIVFLIITIIISAFRRQNDLSYMSTKGWITFLFVPVLTVAMIFMMIYGSSVELLNELFYKLLVLAFTVFIMNILLFYMLDNMIEREREMHDKQLLIEQAEHINKMYQSLSAEREKQKAQAHDHLNHLNIMFNLAQEGNNSKEIEYLSELIDREEECIDIIDTGNPIINAVLNIKYKEAQDKDIIFPLVADNMTDLSIKDSDLVTILSNVLDNAIEAVSDLENKKIYLRITRTEDYLSIDSSNPYRGDPDVKKHRFTTKSNKNDHGFGLSNIRHAVAENNGECFIETQNDTFHITITLPITR